MLLKHFRLWLYDYQIMKLCVDRILVLALRRNIYRCRGLDQKGWRFIVRDVTELYSLVLLL